LLNALEQTTWSSRDTLREELANNSGMILSLELLDLNNGRTMLWRSKAMVDHQTSDSHLVSTLIGGRCSEQMVLSS
jgi:hypothetical protein